jgi:hypothetical protein
MPYVKIDDRDKYHVKAKTAITPGQLNFQITQLITQYVRENQGSTGLTYSLLNEVVGALESAKLEFYRRAVVPYESVKISENGDMYE